ncbi:hypothetical protein L1049_016036 [Liquidambar formosana]|uniref:Uncharacterized protein n=1 Tax=Liquidambar formosana TaxID=63359 RepID=A0AAP0RYQ7_LIQFO
MGKCQRTGGIVTGKVSGAGRQQFLIRSLGGHSDRIHRKTMQETRSMSEISLEADAETILRAITPSLDPY